MLTVAPGSKEIGGLGETFTIENPGVDSVMEVICSVEIEVLYWLRVSAYWFPMPTVAAVTSDLGEGPNQPLVAPLG